MAEDDFLKLLEDSLFGLTAEPAAPKEAAKPASGLKSASSIRGAAIGGPAVAKPVTEVAPAATPVPVPVAPAPAAAAVANAVGMLLYVGSDFETKSFFNSMFKENFQIRMTMDLPEIKNTIVAGGVTLLVFDPSAAVRPGIAITRYIKEKALPVLVAHVTSAVTDNSEEYAKFRHYHLHLQPDFTARVSELAIMGAQIRNKLSL